MHRRLVDDAHPTLRDGTDPELGLAGRTQLAGDEHVERRAETPSDLERHRRPASWEPEHQRIAQRGGPRILDEACGQLAAGVVAVPEAHQVLLSFPRPLRRYPPLGVFGTRRERRGCRPLPGHLTGDRVGSGAPYPFAIAATARPVLLTVDDDPAVSRAVARDLRRRYGDHYRVVRAESGPDALEAAAGVHAARRATSRCCSPTTACPA